MRAQLERSAGGVVVADGKILLISTSAGRRWQLPKGHIERGESAEQAAVREIREETGVHCGVRDRLGEIEYGFRTRSGRPVKKRVTFFLCHYVAGSIVDFDREEVCAAQWYDWQTGLGLLSFANERRLVERARSRLDGDQPGSAE